MPKPNSSAGTYALVLAATKRQVISVGKLGIFKVGPGFYVYVGSALGPGGLAARIGRHARQEKTLRWYVDYLRAVTDLVELWFSPGGQRKECSWARRLARMPGAGIPMPGLRSVRLRLPVAPVLLPRAAGAEDCRDRGVAARSEISGGDRVQIRSGRVGQRTWQRSRIGPRKGGRSHEPRLAELLDAAGDRRTWLAESARRSMPWRTAPAALACAMPTDATTTVLGPTAALGGLP